MEIKNKIRLRLSLCSLFLTLTIPVFCQAKKERIYLVTNDDGYQHENILTLAKCFQELGKVYLIAPKTNRSGSSNMLTDDNIAVEIQEHDPIDNIKVFSLDAAPSIVVRWGVRLIDSLEGKKPDMILSGINSGVNVGLAVVYSGTVGGAREGALLGIPSLAVGIMSAEPDYVGACGIIKNIALDILDKPYKAKLFNLNLPNGKLSEKTSIKQTIVDMNGVILDYAPFVHPRSNRTFFFPTLRLVRKEQKSSDLYEVLNGHVSLTPLLLDMTSYEKLGFDK